MHTAEQNALLKTLQARFDKHPRRHPGVAWADVLARLAGNAAALKTLQGMEASGGEPDVIGPQDAQGGFIFCDCAAETPTGRRSLCYDDEALAARKEHKPAGSALGLAAELGIELLDEAQYHALQALGDFDTKTSSWLRAPEAIRAQGGGLFGDKRYGRVFIYHNGAQSYYASRGFRGAFRV